MSSQRIYLRGQLRAPLQALLIGASAGGVEALLQLLEDLPADYRLPVVCLLHVPDRNDSLLADLLGRRLHLPVKEAEDKEYLCGGRVYVAPAGYHLSIEGDRSFSLSREEPRHFSRPSIDILFESAADAYGEYLAAALLTGANEDGALGLLAVQRAGGLALVQDPADAQVPTMPNAALALLQPDFLLTIAAMRLLLAELDEASATWPGLREVSDVLRPCQHRLFDLGGELAMPDYQALQQEEVERLEVVIDRWNEEVGPLQNFILPGGSRLIAQAHVCRSFARSSERRCQHLNAVEPLRAVGLAYVNRLSDLLFVAARLIARRQGVAEVLWQAAEKP